MPGPKAKKGRSVDAVFSPVVRVKYEIEETRVGQRTNYDKLIMEIWTNGTVGPEMALVEAAKILRKHLNPFVQYAEMGAQVHARAMSSSGVNLTDAAIESKLNLSIAELKLSVRATNCLESENINTVRDLVSRSDLARSGQSGYLPNADVSTVPQALRFMPVGILYFITVPWPWQVGSARQNITLPETAFWVLILYPLMGLGVVQALRRNFQGSSLLVIMGLVIAVLLLALYMPVFNLSATLGS